MEGNEMRYVRWIVLLILAMVLGVFLVRYLAVHPIEMSLQLVIVCLALFLSVALLAVGFKGKAWIVAIPLWLVFVAVGWSAMAYVVLEREDPRPVPALTRAKGDPGDGHTAVIYLTHGEPETYDPIGWINQFKELDDTRVPFIPYLARPLFLYQLRQEYLHVGKSNHRQMHIRMLQSLEKQFRAEGDSQTKFYLSFLDDSPRPDAAAIQALNEGASKIVVCLVFLTVSNHTAEGIELVEGVKPEDYGVSLKFAGPLWDSRTLQSMFLQRANSAIASTDKSKVGVLLVGHGQPDEWDNEFPTETQQEITFRNEILKLFEGDGYKRENLTLAWMEFKEPQPAKKVEEIVRNGAEKVVYFAAAISADSIHSQFDIPKLVHEARVSNGYPLINLDAWNDDPIVIRAIKEKVDPLLR
jgi:protoheme ferro-lyase